MVMSIMLHKKLLPVALLTCLMSIGCSQTAEKATQSVQKAKPAEVKANADSKGASCCLSSAPSRFAIIKTDPLSKKAVAQ